jgi:glycosyltransferase involved in cell wall biosynthesis
MLEPLDPAEVRILTYCPLAYNGRGPAETCVRLLGHPISRPLKYSLIIPRSRKAVPPAIEVVQSLPLGTRYLPWSLISKMGYRQLNRSYLQLLSELSPSNTIAYFWPDPPSELVADARSKGFVTVREMINCYRGTARRVLDEHYGKLGIVPTKRITSDEVVREQKELNLYDYIFSPSECVDDSLLEAGIEQRRILKSSFGWTPSKYNFGNTVASGGKQGRLCVSFVGTICVRKGIPYLLDAWKRSGVKGVLRLVGNTFDEMSNILAEFTSDDSVEILGYRDDVGDIYNSSDFFVLPTLEEGAPQVVYEAAAAGLPVITTPMGRGRIIEHGRNGLVVEPGDVTGLAAAIAQLAASPELRAELGACGARSAAKFSYEVVGAARAEMLLDVLDQARQD